MRRSWLTVVISAGMLMGCSSGTTGVPDAEPKVVDTMCEIYSTGYGAPGTGEWIESRRGYQRVIYDDGTSAYLMANGRQVPC